MRVWLVDDEPAQREILGEILRDEGYGVEVFESPVELLRRSREDDADFDLVLSDLRMPDLTGHELLVALRADRPEVVMVLMTAFATVESAVEAMKDGAFDYLQKPFARDEVVQRLRRAAERARMHRENTRFRHRASTDARSRILGTSDACRRMIQQLERAASSPGDVLLTGESGTGKELAARLVHAASSQAAGPFVPLNCAAVPENLAESEIFGHEKGAFTGATEARAGRFEQADGGVLFLDEVGSMPSSLQAKLLRVLQDRMVERVGSQRTRRVDVRVVAATNQPLLDLVKEGTFRVDLYHRLNVIEVELPPLRERREDVPELVAAFRDDAAERCGVPAPEIDDALLSFFARYDFPGNVRELKNLMERLVALSEGETLSEADLPTSLRAAPSSASPPLREFAGEVAPEALLAEGPISWFEVEERLLREAIRRADGNLSEAARQLGLSYKTFRYRIRKYGISP